MGTHLNLKRITEAWKSRIGHRVWITPYKRYEFRRGVGEFVEYPGGWIGTVVRLDPIHGGCIVVVADDAGVEHEFAPSELILVTEDDCDAV
ncbi:MAG: hypothetical protein CUN56_08880 [Phototrophicales bacterium]|nr:MAG: hypothetical protein CUN56_08880 [Phototrophicales bacterium]